MKKSDFAVYSAKIFKFSEKIGKEEIGKRMSQNLNSLFQKSSQNQFQIIKKIDRCEKIFMISKKTSDFRTFTEELLKKPINCAVDDHFPFFHDFFDYIKKRKQIQF